MKKNYIVEFTYPTIYTYKIKADNPEEAIRLAKKADDGTLEDEKYKYVEDWPSSGDTDFETTPETFIYASENDLGARPMISVTPNKQTLDNTLKNIVNHIQSQYDTTDQINVLLDFGFEEELLKYYGYTKKEIKTAKKER